MNKAKRGKRGLSTGCVPSVCRGFPAPTIFRPRPRHRNDPDLLEVGNGGMTATEYISQMSLWSLVKAPLLISTDLTNMTAETLAILSNKEVIAVNQDPQTLQGVSLTRMGEEVTPL